MIESELLLIRRKAEMLLKNFNGEFAFLLEVMKDKSKVGTQRDLEMTMLSVLGRMEFVALYLGSFVEESKEEMTRRGDGKKQSVKIVRKDEWGE